MKKSSSKSKESSSYSLEGDLTIYEAAAVREAIIAQLKVHKTLDIDLSRVAEIDTSGIQVLLALKKVDAKVRLKNPAQSVIRLIQLLELQNLVPETAH